MSDPRLDADRKAELVAQLMQARRAVGLAKRRGSQADERAARAEVDAAKVALGERGDPWWYDGAPDYNRKLVLNTPYASWAASLDAADQPPSAGQRSKAARPASVRS